MCGKLYRSLGFAHHRYTTSHQIQQQTVKVCSASHKVLLAVGFILDGDHTDHESTQCKCRESAGRIWKAATLQKIS